MSGQDDRFMDLKVHAILTLPNGERLTGLFNTDMTQEMQSYTFSTVSFNTDVFNKVLKYLSYSQLLDVSFNQKYLDDNHIDSLKLDTTSLKPFFPNLEPSYGSHKGCFLRLTLP